MKIKNYEKVLIMETFARLTKIPLYSHLYYKVSVSAAAGHSWEVFVCTVTAVAAAVVVVVVVCIAAVVESSAVVDAVAAATADVVAAVAVASASLT